jgi:hypothetical protein
LSVATGEAVSSSSVTNTLPTSAAPPLLLATEEQLGVAGLREELVTVAGGVEYSHDTGTNGGCCSCISCWPLIWNHPREGLKNREERIIYGEETVMIRTPD